MEGGCPCSYPSCELEKVLPENILLRYNERQAEEAVAATCADELVRWVLVQNPSTLRLDEKQFKVKYFLQKEFIFCGFSLYKILSYFGLFQFFINLQKKMLRTLAALF